MKKEMLLTKEEFADKCKNLSKEQLFEFAKEYAIDLTISQLNPDRVREWLHAQVSQLNEIISNLGDDDKIQFLISDRQRYINRLMRINEDKATGGIT